RDLRDELPSHARAELGLRVPLRARADGGLRPAPVQGVQAPRLGLKRQLHAPGAWLKAGANSAASAPGRKTRKDAPPPPRSSTHALPPCSSANRATRERPIPTPGEWGVRRGPCRKGSK